MKISTIQSIFRALFRAFIMTFITLIFDPNLAWMAFFTVLISVFTEIDSISNNKSNLKPFKHVSLMIYRGYTLSMVILCFNATAVWCLPLGLLFGLLSEAEYLAHRK